MPGRFGVTCETHDPAVLHCLTALSHFAEYGAFNVGQETRRAPMTVPRGWLREDGRVTFRFSDPMRRGAFLGEATRLLAGKWIRVELIEA